MRDERYSIEVRSLYLSPSVVRSYICKSYTFYHILDLYHSILVHSPLYILSWWVNSCQDTPWPPLLATLSPPPCTTTGTQNSSAWRSVLCADCSLNAPSDPVGVSNNSTSPTTREWPSLLNLVKDRSKNGLHLRGPCSSSRPSYGDGLSDSEHRATEGRGIDIKPWSYIKYI